MKTTLEAEESENEPSPVKSSPPRNELLEKINFLSSSMTETEQATETDDRQEFANRLAAQNSALRSLGKNDFEAEVKGGTLEGLDEMKEAIEDIKSESKSESQIDQSAQSESVFSDASKSLDESVASSYSTDADSTKSKVSLEKSLEISKTETKTEQNSVSELEESVADQSSKTNDSYNDSEFEDSTEKLSSTARSVTPVMLATDLEPIVPEIDQVPEVPPIRISISTKNSTPEPIAESEPVVADSEPEKPHEPKLDESAEVEIVGIGKTDEIDKLFENNDRKVNALDLFDDNEADLSKTKDIALSESSLIETLKVYEQLQASRSIENEFQAHDEAERVNTTTFKKPKTFNTSFKKKTPKKEAPKPAPKPIKDYSHIKSSGYGRSKPVQDTSRPKISPRLQAKVETKKRERIAQQANERLRASANYTPTLPVANQSTTLAQNSDLVDTLRREVEQERTIRLQALYC